MIAAEKKRTDWLTERSQKKNPEENEMNAL